MLQVFRAQLGDKLIGQIEEALAYGGHTHSLNDLVTACMSGDAQIHLGRESVAFTEIVSYPRARALHVWLVAGDLDELFGPILERVEAAAQHYGCDRLTLVGRRGWERAAAKIGF